MTDRIAEIEARYKETWDQDVRYLLDEVKRLQQKPRVNVINDQLVTILTERNEKLEAVRSAAKDFMVKLMSGRAKADKLQIALAACEEKDE